MPLFDFRAGICRQKIILIINFFSQHEFVLVFLGFFMEKTKNNRNKKTNYQLIIRIELLILAVCFVIGLFQFVNIPPSLEEVIALATTRKPETFTELYFENHVNLPKDIKRFEQYKFTFTIHNLENKDIDYPYIVYLQRGAEKTIIYKDRVYVKNNEFKSIKKTVGPLKNLRSKIVVELVDKNQNISFWMEK